MKSIPWEVMSNYDPISIEEALENAKEDLRNYDVKSVIEPPLEDDFNHDLNAIQPADFHGWSLEKRQFARALLVYSHSKDLIPERLNRNLFDYYFSQLAEDGSNKAELIAALWAESISL